MRMIDLTGRKIGRWTVVSRAENDPKGQSRWNCKCDCGTERDVPGVTLRGDRTHSCGCLKTELTIARSTKHGHSSSTTISPTYHSWVGMTQRCSNPKHKDYDRYGGRGITVCEKWRTFSGFLEDMGEKPEGSSIERAENDLNYDKDNCKWATVSEQANNKSNNRVVEFDGESLTVAQWAIKTGINNNTILDRLNRGWDVKNVLTKEVNPHNKKFLTIDGETKEIGEWIKNKGIKVSTYYYRIKKGMTPEEALSA